MQRVSEDVRLLCLLMTRLRGHTDTSSLNTCTRHIHTHTLAFFLSPPHNCVWMMNGHCTTHHQRLERNMCVVVLYQPVYFKSRALSSPMLGCFSKRQILASLSNFWWSEGKRNTRHKHKWKWVIFNACHYSFGVTGSLNHLTWSSLQVSFDPAEDIVISVSVMYLTVTLLHVCLCACALACCRPQLFSLSELK